MKKLFIILGVLFTQQLFAQSYVHQVLILNEGYFDYTTNYLYNYDRVNKTDFSNLYYDYLNANHRPNFLIVYMFI